MKERKFVSKRRVLVMDDLELIGIDYLWEIALKGSERIVGRAVNLLKQSYTNLGPKLRANQVRRQRAVDYVNLVLSSSDLSVILST